MFILIQPQGAWPEYLQYDLENLMVGFVYIIIVTFNKGEKQPGLSWTVGESVKPCNDSSSAWDRV